MSCVNIKSKEFKDAAKRLNLSSETLEMIVYEYQNTVGNEDTFPSDGYIQSKLQGRSHKLSESQEKLWEQRYSEPKEYTSKEDANNAVNEALRFFERDSIVLYQDNSGKYILRVAEPDYTEEYNAILKNAPRDSQGRLLASNDKPSNLTERQYAQVRTKAFKRWFGDWEKFANITEEELQAASLIFDRVPELAKIGTPTEYAAYIKEIFPNSVEKEVYWHGSNEDFSEGFASAKRGEGSGALETKKRNDLYLNKQGWASLQYVNGINRKGRDKNGFAHWNKLWWELKEIMSNGRRENNDWKDIVIDESTIRQAIPNKKGVFNRDSGGKNGKWLSERKADYGYENKSDKEFFEEIFGIKLGKDTFNTWTARNAEIFKSLEKSAKGINPVVIDVRNPIIEEGQNTYYEEQRGLFTTADAKGNDAILSKKADNEFNSDVAIVINANNDNVYWLGTKSDIERFRQWKTNNDASKVVDENGEPLVVYHGNTDTNIIKFTKGKGRYIKDGNYYFSPSKSIAESYATNGMSEVADINDYLVIGYNVDADSEEAKYADFNSAEEFFNASLGGKVYSVFLNIKNPLFSDTITPKIEKPYDGAITIPVNDTQGTLRGEKVRQYIATESNQIKSATDNIGTFSTENDRIDRMTEGYSEREQIILNALPLSIDSSTIFELYKSVDSNNPYHQMFKQLVDILWSNNIPIDLIPDFKHEDIASIPQRKFKSAPITINPERLLGYIMREDSSSARGTMMRIITHELVHALTAELLETNSSWSEIRGFDKAQEQFAKDIESLYEEVKKAIGEEDWYGLKNKKEFIAEALTNSKFQIRLSKIKSKNNRNVFQKLVDSIVSMFNTLFERHNIDIKSSVLEDILTVSQDYFNYAKKGFNIDIDNFEGSNYYIKSGLTYLPYRNLNIGDTLSGNVGEQISRFKEIINKAVEEYNAKHHYDGGNKTTARKHFSEKIKDNTAYSKFITTLSDKIISKLEKEGKSIRIIPSNELSSSMAVETKGNTIILMYNPKLIAEDAERLDYIIAHELVHTVTSSAVNNVMDGNATSEEEKFVNDVWSIIKELNDKEGFAWNFGFNIDTKEGRAKHIKEFIANVMTNPNMQSHLARIKTGNKKSLWNRFIDSIRNLVSSYLGTNINDSYLEELMNTISTHIDSKSGGVTTPKSIDQITEGYPKRDRELVTESLFSKDAEDTLRERIEENVRKEIQRLEKIIEDHNTVKHLIEQSIRTNGISLRTKKDVDDYNEAYGTNVEWEIGAGEAKTNTGDLKKRLTEIKDPNYARKEVQRLKSNLILSDAIARQNAIDKDLELLSREDYMTEGELSKKIIPSEAEMYSGAANGSDQEWARLLRNLGVSVIDYTVQSFEKLSKEWQDKLDREYKEVVHRIGRRGLPREEYRGKLVRRDMMQADKADAVFAIGTVAKNGLVDGGTGYATTRGIIRGIPVYLFDQADNTWKVWDGSKFTPTSRPILTKHAAVVGTRELKENGKQAITSVVNASIATREQVAEDSKTKEELFKEPIIPTEETQDKTVEAMEIREQQLENLMNSTLVTASEVRELANQIAYAMSDLLTDYYNNPDLLFENFPEKRTLNKDKERDEESKKKDRRKIREMSRVELMNFVGMENIKALLKNKFDPRNAKYSKLSTMMKAKLISRNWEALIVLSKTTFNTLEGVEEKNADDFNGFEDNAEIEEAEGNLQEHWQEEMRTRDIAKSLTQLVRNYLRQCYVLEYTGETDENGNKLTRVKESEFGIKLRVNEPDAIRSILRWGLGSRDLRELAAKLKEKSNENPWLNQLIDKLNPDATALTTEDKYFQSQFWSVFNRNFQSYYIVKADGEVTRFMPVNDDLTLRNTVNSIEAMFRLGEHPLMNINKGVNKSKLEELEEKYKKLKERLSDKNLNVAADLQSIELLKSILKIIGFEASEDYIRRAIADDNFNKSLNSLSTIIESLKKNVDNKEYNPFEFGNKQDSIIGYLKSFLSPYVSYIEDTSVNSFYDSGKMYQSYVIPSYLTKLMNKFSLSEEQFLEFVEKEYGKYPWFKMKTRDITTGWRNPWLEKMVRDPKARKIFKHQVMLNYGGKSYMKNLSSSEYTIALIAAYFTGSTNTKGSEVPAWFRVPMLSNKASAEFIRFYSQRGNNYQEVLLDGFKKMFDQEVSRIQTVRRRNLSKSDPRFIKSFDSNGKRFVLFDFMNEYLDGKSSTTKYGELLNRFIEGKKELTPEEEVWLLDETKKIIAAEINRIADSTIEEWDKSGILGALKSVEGISKDSMRDQLVNFIWNDKFAAMNILELTIVDPAYYKDAEDLQKRLAQIHTPGVRPNIYAKDSEGREVTDGIHRTIILNDLEDFISNVIDNITEVFDAKIRNAKSDEEKVGIEALKDSIIKQFKGINVTDAQGYCSPTAYRKKAIMLGKWSEEQEDVYKKLLSGDFTYSDLKVAFQPLKPFIYSNIDTKVSAEGAPLDILKTGVQIKNSEYLIVLADAILRGTSTSRPNILKVLFDVMEESQLTEEAYTNSKGEKKSRKVPAKNGIDTINFASTVKTGLHAAIDLNEFLNEEGGEIKAREALKEVIYQEDGKYNTEYVYEMPYEDYAVPQEVPKHFLEHSQIMGSQARYLLVADLEPGATFTIEGKEYTREQFIEEYEKTIAENIESSIENLAKELHLDSKNVKERNIAISKILQKECENPRYGIDLLQACSVDKDGKFRVPLSDPIQAKRIEQMINSIIKNRINKQEIAGGPVVQVSNYGLSETLNIRFKDKDGKLLATKKEFEANEGLKSSYKSYEEYVRSNQAGIAHFEVLAPFYLRDVFSNFSNKDGSIDIKTIENLTDKDGNKVGDELLKMIGYRIPTEALYSIAPLKVIGFLPKEAGEGIMLPYDITTITGSDFDKLNVEVKLC